MVNETQVTVQGYVGATPKLLVPADGGDPYATVRVGSTYRFRTPDGEWRDGRTQWFAVKLNGDLARNVCHGVRKGDSVLVRGRLDYEEYTTKEGEAAWNAVIRPNAFGLEMSRAQATATRVTYTSASSDGEQEPEEEPARREDDAPPDMSGFEEVDENGAPLGTTDGEGGEDSDDRPIVERIGVPF